MNLQEIRNKYPEYNDLSDGELASGLHKKFYSDMPFEEFSSKIGFQAEPMPKPKMDFSFTPSPVEQPSFMEEVVQPSLQEIGKGFEQFPEEHSLRGIDPWLTVTQTAEAVPRGVISWADSALLRVQEAARQLSDSGEVDPDVIDAIGKEREGLFDKEVTDPGAKLILSTIGAVPGQSVHC